AQRLEGRLQLARIAGVEELAVELGRIVIGRSGIVGDALEDGRSGLQFRAHARVQQIAEPERVDVDGSLIRPIRVVADRVRDDLCEVPRRVVRVLYMARYGAVRILVDQPLAVECWIVPLERAWTIRRLGQIGL